MIKTKNATKKQIMEMESDLLFYQYIQNEYSEGHNNKDFQDVFTNYYLKTQGIIRLPENRIPFFNVLFRCKKDDDLIELVKLLNNEMATDMYEFSFATKLLHTVNPNSPIYDSKIHMYLRNEEGVPFKAPERSIERIEYNWKQLNQWYKNFIEKDERCEQWINWFDSIFPSFKEISIVKKIDTIIFFLS